MRFTIAASLVFCSTLGLGCALDEVELGETESPELSSGSTLPPVERTVKSIVDEEVGPLYDTAGRRLYAGLSVIVIRNGTRYQYHYGEAVLGSGVRPNSSTYYAIGSVTKTFTATMLALLDRRGVVDLTDPLDDHTAYPLGADGARMTLQDLALHHSGLTRNPPGGETPYQTGTYNGDFAALMGSLDDCDSCGAPVPLTDEGTYSNYGYAVLAHVLSKKISSYTTVQGAFNTTLLDPLGMTSTRGKLYLTESSCVAASDTCSWSDYGECQYLAGCNMTFSPRAAVGYYASGGWIFRSSDEGSDDAIKAGSGTLWSTPADMTKWLAYHMDASSGASTELRAILPTVHRVRTGADDLALFGKSFVTPEGHVAIRKTGLIDNQFQTYMAFIDGGTTGVVILSNLDGYSTGDLGVRLLDALVN